ncbi:hypothetical protein A9Q99_25530 [Gammaproteobacteria bacterium 45_16_T64]|nr:hypothetical protein A9Q99_25530 [Gammaproteobacteria bacterium 45_16_T64]
MVKMGVIAYDNCYLSSLSGPMDAFQVANAYSCRQLGPSGTQFSWNTVSITGEPVKTSGGISIATDMSIANADVFDLIYLPAFPYQGALAMDKMAEELRPLLDWLVVQWKRGATLVTICTGGFLMAETGLLDGREATTTWWLEKQFHKRYPNVKLNSRAMITEQDRLMCAGAMTSYQNMAVHLIERYATADLAIQCAKAMLIDTSVSAQSPYQNLLMDEASGDPVVAKAQYWLQNHAKENIDQAELAQKMGVSQRTLIRRFKAELDLTPLNYLQNIRIETAKQLLENTTLPLIEVTEHVGYTDISSFSRLFKQRTGLTPAAYRQRFKAKEA